MTRERTIRFHVVPFKFPSVIVIRGRHSLHNVLIRLRGINGEYYCRLPFAEYKFVAAGRNGRRKESPELKTPARDGHYNIIRHRILIRIAADPIDNIEPEIHAAFFLQWVGSSDQEFCTVNNSGERKDHEPLN